MNYKRINKIAEELENQLGINEEIDERVDEEQIDTDVVEPSIEAEEDENLTPSEEQITASKRLKNIIRILCAKKKELTSGQKLKLSASLTKIAGYLHKADGEEEEGVKKTDIMKSVGIGFSKNGPLKTKINWAAPSLKSKGITPMSKLNELTIDDLRLILTNVRGVNV